MNSLNFFRTFSKERSYLLRNLELTKLNLFVKHLQEIEEHSEVMFKQIRRKMNAAKIVGQYIGLRFEINIAASLIRKGIAFGKGESPDFRIESGKGSISIECTSSHISAHKQYDLKYKIGASIKQKSKEEYTNYNTAIFVDSANIIYNMARNQMLPGKDQIKEYVKQSLSPTKLGNATIFTYVFAANSNEFQSDYIKVDNQGIAEPLVLFLDKYYPVGTVFIKPAVLPGTG